MPDLADHLDDKNMEEVGIFIENEVIKNKLCRDQCVEFKKLMAEFIVKYKLYEVPANKLDKIYSQYYSKADLANKQEADADEIGFEFIARADIDPDSYTNFDSFAARKFQDIENCDFGLDSEFARGIKSHPSSCWRIENIYQMRQKQAAIYKKFLIKKSKHLINYPSLADVKAEMIELLRDKKSGNPDSLAIPAAEDISELPVVEEDADIGFLKLK